MIIVHGRGRRFPVHREDAFAARWDDLSQGKRGGLGLTRKTQRRGKSAQIDVQAAEEDDGGHAA
jgi:hypothetical protein